MTHPSYMTEFSEKKAWKTLSKDEKHIGVFVGIYTSVRGHPVLIEMNSSIRDNAASCLGTVTILNSYRNFTYDKRFIVSEETLTAFQSMNTKELENYYPPEWDELYRYLGAFVINVWGAG